MVQHEENLHEKTTSLPARLFFSMGELETESMKSSFQALANRLEQGRYADLVAKRAIINDETHASVKAAAYTKGLKEIFKP